MSSSSLFLPRPLWSRPKYLLFGLIGLMIVYVLGHNEYFFVEPHAPVWQHYQPFKWWLLPHGLAGACALLLAPMQFSDRLRKRFLGLHRNVGRVYVFGALVLAPLGFYIQYFQERFGAPRSFSVLSASDSARLVVTTGIAFMFAVRRNIREHRQWMTRSYAV